MREATSLPNPNPSSRLVNNKRKKRKQQSPRNLLNKPKRLKQNPQRLPKLLPLLRHLPLQMKVSKP
jgi:hypothetical protein